MSDRTSSFVKPKKSRIVVPIIIAFIVLSALALFLFTPVFDALKPYKVIKIGYSRYDYPPLHSHDRNGVLEGFDIDLAREAARIMDIEIEFVPIDWASRDASLKSREVDMLWGGLEWLSYNEKVMKFTEPYLQSDIVLLMPQDRNYAAFEDLNGLEICTLNFTAAFDYVQLYNRDVIKSRRSFTPPEYGSLLDALSSGNFDCMITDTSFATFFLMSNSDETYKMSDVIFESSYAVGLRPRDKKLLERLQDALDQLQADGTIDSLKEKWIGD